MCFAKIMFIKLSQHWKLSSVSDKWQLVSGLESAGSLKSTISPTVTERI